MLNFHLSFNPKYLCKTHTLWDWWNKGRHRLEVNRCATLWDSMDYSPQAPLFMEVPRQECWNGLPFPFPGHLPDSGMEPGSPVYHLSHQRKPFTYMHTYICTYVHPFIPTWICDWELNVSDLMGQSTVLKPLLTK